MLTVRKVETAIVSHFYFTACLLGSVELVLEIVIRIRLVTITQVYGLPIRTGVSPIQAG